MKRLIRRAAVQNLYHGTTFDSFKKIMNSGKISPNASEGAGKLGKGSSAGYVFLTGTESKAEEYSMQWMPSNSVGPRIVLEVSVDDEHLTPDNDDCYNCETWQESLDEIDQVCFEGEISINQIVSINFYNPENYSFMFAATVNDWEEKYEKTKEYYAGEQDFDTMKQHRNMTYKEYHNIDNDY